MEEIKVSILIPLYNDEKYIKNCLISILRQTYRNLEIIIVNDGSTDNSYKICEECLKNENISYKIINISNSGVCVARNIAVENMTGDYAIFVDSDDEIEENMCEEIVNLANKYKADLITYDYKNLYADGTIRDRFKNDEQIEVYTPYEASLQYILKNENFSMVLWRRMYSKELIKSVKFTENKLPEDYATAFDYYSKANKVVHIKKSFYIYRIKDNGLTIRKNLKSYIDSFQIKKEVYEKEKSKFKNTKYMKNINSTFFNSIVRSFVEFSLSENSEKQKRYLQECRNEIKNIKIKDLNMKSSIIYIVYRLNSNILIKVANYTMNKQIKKR